MAFAISPFLQVQRFFWLCSDQGDQMGTSLRASSAASRSTTVLGILRRVPKLICHRSVGKGPNRRNEPR